MLVVVIDDVEDSLALVDIAKEDFPQLSIVACARNITHCYQLMDRGVTIVERETFDASLQLGRRVLQKLGFSAYQARQMIAMKFRAHNIKIMHAVIHITGISSSGCPWQTSQRRAGRNVCAGYRSATN